MFIYFFIFLLLLNKNTFAEDLYIGSPARDFTLDIATKDTIIRGGFTLSKHIGKQPIVLAFYPADWSDGCTKEMCTMRDDFTSLKNLNAILFGISGDYAYSHREWAKELDLPFALLSDHEHTAGKLYNSYDKKSGYNKRTIVVIDTAGTIAYIDMHYSPKDSQSFNKLKKALLTIH
ncbi:MAG: redoxin domain-containing protein [Ignavibacteria bacterium]|nr:redoxin domain-containing protein [Ignavibacteria bacterium]